MDLLCFFFQKHEETTPAARILKKPQNARPNDKKETSFMPAARKTNYCYNLNSSSCFSYYEAR
jgi:hypothetical protein